MIPKSFMWKAFISICFVLVFLAVLSITLQFTFSEAIASIQLVFTILGFSFVLYTLYVALAQLRKSMAKPQLKVSFSEDGKTEAIFDVFKDKPRKETLELWITNTGNTVTKTFQIDLEVPDIFTPKYIDTITASKLSSTGDKRIYPFYNDGEFCLFVNRPVKIPSFILPLEVSPDNYDECPNRFEVKYKVFGDWAETQEGKLKVICKKKQEVS